MPKPDHLPASLREFAFRHAVALDPGQDFNAHMDRLVRGVDELLGRVSPNDKKEGLTHDSEAANRNKRGFGWFSRS